MSSSRQSSTPPSPKMVAKLRQRIGFVGAGQMALALAKGFMASGLVAPNQVLTSAPSDTNLMLWRQLGAETTNDNTKVVVECDIIFLAVKPNVFSKMVAALQISAMEGCENLLDETTENSKGETEVEGHEEGPASSSKLREKLLTHDSKLFVSVMAGVTLKSLSLSLSRVAKNPRIIRTHPNTPATIGCGCAVYSLGDGASEADGELIAQLFSSVGLVENVPEYQQDAFTGLAGSGPAYVYTFLEALADGGVRMGLPRHLSVKFAAQMMLGAAKMSIETGKHTGQLKDAVTSPGGTTIRGLQVLEKAGVRGVLMDAVQASAERAKELGDTN